MNEIDAIFKFSGVYLKYLILDCLKENILSENIPNEETVRVFKETDERKNLVHYENADDLIAKLGLK